MESRDPERIQETLKAYIDTKSYLGGVNLEGVVIRNLGQEYIKGDIDLKYLLAKQVSTKFKEKMSGKKRRDKSSWQAYQDQYRTEARWAKAIQHLRDDNKLTGELRDIGLYISEIKKDITEECKQEICEYLWATYGTQLLRNACVGAAEYFKERYYGGSFCDIESGGL
jgi:hypothetical protein